MCSDCVTCLEGSELHFSGAKAEENEAGFKRDLVETYEARMVARLELERSRIVKDFSNSVTASNAPRTSFTARSLAHNSSAHSVIA